MVGCADFHSNRILLQSKRVEKASIFVILFVINEPSPGTNVANSALGWISLLKASDKVMYNKLYNSPEIMQFITGPEQMGQISLSYMTTFTFH